MFPERKRKVESTAGDFIEKHVESGHKKDRERITEKRNIEAVEISKNSFVV